MEEEVVNRLRAFDLSKDEEIGIRIERDDFTASQEECERSVVGKLHGNKKISFQGLKNTMVGLWRVNGELKVRELGPNVFHFIFPSKDDKQKVLDGRSWTFDGQFLVLREWEEGIERKEEAFRFIRCWVQVWDIPNHWISKTVGRKIGGMFRSMYDIIIPETGSSKGRHIKMQVDIDLLKAPPRGTMLREGEKEVWITFKYEQIPGICSYCGVVGHSSTNCNRRQQDIKKEQLKENQYGEWIKAEPFKRRTNEGNPKRMTGRVVRSELPGSSTNADYPNQNKKTLTDDPPRQETKVTSSLYQTNLDSQMPTLVRTKANPEVTSIPNSPISTQNKQLMTIEQQSGGTTQITLTEDLPRQETIMTNSLIAMIYEPQNSNPARIYTNHEAISIPHSPTSIQSTQPMILEQETEKTFQIELPVLINIPVLPDNNFRHLQEVKQLSVADPTCTYLHSEEVMIRRWKRRKGKESTGSSNLLQYESDYKGTNAAKRKWTLRDKEKSLDLKENLEKRQQTAQGEEIFSAVMVEEASLKWPQIDQ